MRISDWSSDVCSSDLLGSQCLLLGGNLRVAVLLGGVGLLAWIVLTYTIFTVLTIKRNKPTLDRGINGGWLLAVVATQSMAVLAGLIALEVPQPLRVELNFFALSMWLWGGMLYIWMRSEEHTSELQSLMRISYAVFCLKKKK